MSMRNHLAGLLLLGLLVGCGDSEEPDDPPSSEPTPGETETTGPTASDTASGDPAAYLPTPSGVTLTEPGTELDLREAATAAWTPRQDLVGVVELAVGTLEVTTIKKSLASYELEGAEARSTPYFVKTAAINRGDTDLGGRQLPLYAVADDQTLVAPTGIEQTFEPCPNSLLPAVFAPGDQAGTCLVFLLPEGTSLEAVMFRPPEGVVPLTWAGEVVDLTKPEKDKKKRDKKKRDKKAPRKDQDRG